MNLRKSFFSDATEIRTERINQDFIKDVIKPIHGTTTLAFIFQGGMIIAVDSRASAGSYIASQTVTKVIKVNKYLLGTMAGAAADCQYWERAMGNHAKFFEYNYGTRISTAAASKMLSNMLYRYKGYGLSVGSMVCGWDNDGPAIFYVDNDGKRYGGNLFSVGSGSTIAYGVLVGGYKYDMSKEEALELGKNAIYHAAHRDAYSGGTVNLYFMDANGWVKISQHDVSEIYHSLNK